MRGRTFLVAALITAPIVGLTLLGRVDESGRSQHDPATLYTVQLGDTLGAIAARHGVSADALARVNRNPDHDRIEVGDVLTIPVGAQRPTTSRRADPLRTDSDWYRSAAGDAGVEVGDCSAYRNGDYDRAIRAGGFLRLLTCFQAEADDIEAEHSRILNEWTEEDPPACLDLYDYLGRLDAFAARTEAVAVRGEVQPMRGFLLDTLGYDMPTKLRATVGPYREHRQEFEETLRDLCAP